MTIPQLLYGSETWIIKGKGISRVQGAEMRFLKDLKGCRAAKNKLVHNDNSLMFFCVLLSTC